MINDPLPLKRSPRPLPRRRDRGSSLGLPELVIDSGLLVADKKHDHHEMTLDIASRCNLYASRHGAGIIPPAPFNRPTLPSSLAFYVQIIPNPDVIFDYTVFSRTTRASPIRRLAALPSSRAKGTPGKIYVVARVLVEFQNVYQIKILCLLILKLLYLLSYKCDLYIYSLPIFVAIYSRI